MAARRSEDESREGRGTTAYFKALAWLALVVIGLAMAGGLIWWVYRAFSRFFGAYDAAGQ